MLARRLVTLALFVGAASPLLAQDSTARSGLFVVGAGVSSARGRSAGPAGQLGYEWRAPASRFGIRLAAEYMGDPATSFQLFGSNGSDILPISTVRTTGSRFSLGALTTFALATGRVQPYLISGVMLQHRRIDHRVTRIDPAPASFAFEDGGPESTYKTRDLAFGIQGGLGVRARVGRSWLFTEIRSQSTGSSPFSTRIATPVTFGIQFE